MNEASRIATAGSCFAQHFSKALVARGYNWINAEPAPPYLQNGKTFGYGVFSARTGNIYTARTWRQWLELAFEKREDITEVWENGGRFYDPLRPAIEPNGFASEQEVIEARRATLASIRNAMNKSNLVVFTMGLTESWRNARTGVEYAMCPGTLAGEFDETQHRFHNAGYEEIIADMRECIRLVRRAEKGRGKRILLTVSPVPLTATASGEHVMTATTFSKSILRAVAGQIQAQSRVVDYFPSYEIITSPAFRGAFFNPNLRTVSQAGVDFVMSQFFHAQAKTFGTHKLPKLPSTSPEDDKTSDVLCEEEFLATFGKG
ncbi:GSCFA domain-containing protein [Actibacterium pelagium]|uniref:GSCFA domain-containing protein n=1 Tax=Actibacterium pelagium TaxID=2029103 RepID=UPI001E431536|nr:GSCFA domain-containing protein [Actibacterium pelagium]